MIIYLGGLVVIGLFFLVNLLHLVHTGTLDFWSGVATLLVAAFTVLILSMSWAYLETLDWQQPIVIWNSGNFTSPL